MIKKKKTCIAVFLLGVLLALAQSALATNVAQVSAGYFHSMVVRTDGTLWGWGNNSYGQLGDGTTTDRAVPIQIGFATDWKAVSAGYYHTLAIKTDGTLWAWGYNGNGQLGDGTTNQSLVPVQIGTETWQAVSSGCYHAVAIKTDGTLWAWGYNGSGQLGDGTTNQSLVPVQIGTETWQSAAAGGEHTVAVKMDGTAWAWGYNGNGQLGNGGTTQSLVPVLVSGAVATWKSAAAGFAHSMIVRTDGSLWAWGYNANGQVGDGTVVQKLSPVRIGATVTTWKSAVAGLAHTMALRTDGSLWTWGYNGYGQLGNGGTAQSNAPVQISPGALWLSVAPGSNYSVAARTDGTLWTWGGNGYGQLGDGIAADKAVPVQIGTLATWKTPAAGAHHTAVAKTDGTLWACGYNAYGQIGDAATSTNKSVPVRIGAAITTWKLPSAGIGHTAVARTDGTLWTWGFNAYGQLGNGATTSSAVPVQVGTATTWKLPAVGNYHTVALRTDGTLWAWGYNAYGQLGNGTTLQSTSPVKIGAASNWQSATAGSNHTVAVKTDGTLWAWGYNGYGQLGDGTTNQRLVPVQIGSDANWLLATAGSNHTVAVKTDGTLWAWGHNGNGQLGDGTTNQHLVPVQIGSDANWLLATAGSNHALAVKTDGTLWAWGYNGYGQLGDGTTIQRLAPVQVSAESWQAMAAGSDHSVAVKTDGTLWAWGYNAYGQLCDGTSWKEAPAQISLVDAEWTVTATAGAHGAIDPSGPQTVAHGDTFVFTLVPDEGYAIGSVSGCGGTLNEYLYTTGPISSDCLVTATFVDAEWTVTATAGAHGAIDPSGPQTVVHGGTLAFTLVPDEGYAIQSVSGCGGTLNEYLYTTGPITGNCSVTAIFRETDSDGDGIDDAWEMDHFGNLTEADENSDYDHDDYSDLQEYLNELANEKDPEGNSYDPKVKNAPEGTGYRGSSYLPGIYRLLL